MKMKFVTLLLSTVLICVLASDDCWVVQYDMGVNGGIRHPVLSMDQCQDDCIRNDSCTGFDWNNREPNCYLLGPWSESQLLHKSDVIHYTYQCRGAAYVPLNSRYYLVFKNKNWTDAQSHCDRSYHAKLVVIGDQVDQLRLHTFLEGVSEQSYNACNKLHGFGVYLWVAGYRVNPSQNIFVWKLHTTRTQYGGGENHVTTSPMNYTYWYLNQPDNKGGTERCVNIWPNMHFQWNDAPCGRRYCFVCEDRNQ